MGKRVLNFITELFLFLPLSVILTGCAWFPIFMVFSTIDGGEVMNLIIFIPLCCGIFWGIGFGVSKLLYWIKGRQTNEFYDVDYHNVDYNVEESFWIQDYYTITETHTYGTRTETSNTGWGWMAILTSFVALPCSLIATIVSFLALFMPAIYSTPWRIEDGDVGGVNLFLHAAFDFVIIPVEMRRTGRPNALGLILLPLAVISPFASLILGSVIGDFLRMALGGIVPEWIAIILFIIGCLLALSMVIIIIEKCVLAVIDFSKYRVIRTLILVGILTVILTLICAFFLALV
ncbi:MAG: hypothetical protein IKC87_06980 [Clostridia bacterium]|nr:hypothetical protein [Clostridia bacterium]